MTKDIASIQYYSLSTAGVFTSSWVSSLFTFFWFSQLFFCISLSSGLAVYQLWAFKRGESTLRPKKDSFGIFGSIWKRESFSEFPLQTELCPKPILRHNTLEWCTIESKTDHLIVRCLPSFSMKGWKIAASLKVRKIKDSGLCRTFSSPFSLPLFNQANKHTEEDHPIKNLLHPDLWFDALHM